MTLLKSKSIQNQIKICLEPQMLFESSLHPGPQPPPMKQNIIMMTNLPWLKHKLDLSTIATTLILKLPCLYFPCLHFLLHHHHHHHRCHPHNVDLISHQSSRSFSSSPLLPRHHHALPLKPCSSWPFVSILIYVNSCLSQFLIHILHKSWSFLYWWDGDSNELAWYRWENLDTFASPSSVHAPPQSGYKTVKLDRTWLHIQNTAHWGVLIVKPSGDKTVQLTSLSSHCLQLSQSWCH